MAASWAAVVRGTSRPLVVELTSSMAWGSGAAPVPLIASWARSVDRGRNAKAKAPAHVVARRDRLLYPGVRVAVISWGSVVRIQFLEAFADQVLAQQVHAFVEFLDVEGLFLDGDPELGVEVVEAEGPVLLPLVAALDGG